MKYQRNPQTNLQIRIIKKKSLRGRKDFQCRYVYQYHTIYDERPWKMFHRVYKQNNPRCYTNLRPVSSNQEYDGYDDTGNRENNSSDQVKAQI